MIQIERLHRLQATSIAMGLSAAMLASSASAQSGEVDPDKDNLQGLKTCQVIANDADRLECFDKAVGSIVTATESGELQVFDREDAKETRRSLFGFKVPNLGIFGSGDDDDEEEELFQTTIASSRTLNSKTWRITTAEGAVWELTNIPRKQRAIEPGDTVEFKPASMGTYFVRIERQRGVRGRRVQ